MSYEWDTSCADLELHRLGNGFTEYDHFNFAAVFARNYMATQAVVHVITGSLRGSGKAEVSASTSHRWEAEMSYGGLSGGVKNPVRYAVSELYGQSPSYGGNHNFLEPTEFIDDEMIGPVASFISRGRNTPHPEAGGL